MPSTSTSSQGSTAGSQEGTSTSSQGGGDVGKYVHLQPLAHTEQVAKAEALWALKGCSKRVVL